MSIGTNLLENWSSSYWKKIAEFSQRWFDHVMLSQLEVPVKVDKVKDGLINSDRGRIKDKASTYYYDLKIQDHPKS